jgi:hypothetical protein
VTWSETAKVVLAEDAFGGVDALIVEGVPHPVAALYEAAGGGVPEDVTPIQLSWRPGRSLLVRYRVRASTGMLRGERQVVATVGEIPEGAVQIEGPQGTIGAWVVPHDPVLPGLASALDVSTVTRLLRALDQTEDVESLRLRSYRPTRRAVVEVSAGPASLYLKVVRPSEAEGLHKRHRYLAERMPVPDSLGMSQELGVAVIQALPGVDLRRILRSGRGQLPAAASISRLLEAIPEPPADYRTRSPLDHHQRLFELLRSIVPEQEEVIRASILSAGPSDEGGLVPVHGDFHEAQILMRGSDPVGLIDVDAYGWGHPGDDPATMLGHLSVLVQSAADENRVLGLARDLIRIWDRKVDPVDLRRRTASVVLGLATGPFRVQAPDWPALTRRRVGLAVQWAQSADRIANSES